MNVDAPSYAPPSRVWVRAVDIPNAAGQRAVISHDERLTWEDVRCLTDVQTDGGEPLVLVVTEEVWWRWVLTHESLRTERPAPGTWWPARMVWVSVRDSQDLWVDAAGDLVVS